MTQVTLDIDAVINARATKGNAYMWNSFGERAHRDVSPKADARARLYQSRIHTYEILDVAQRYRAIGPSEFESLFDGSKGFMRHIVGLWKSQRKELAA